jgi:ABC-2 type transport system ATP-binding protein
MKIAEAKNLTKKYGSLVAVDGFDLHANEGEILALVGPDGAGKTSLFRSLCGLINFDGGEAVIAGYDVARQFDRIKQLLGYMPQVFSLYQDLSVEENLRFYAGLFGLSKSEFSQRKEKLYQFSGLRDFRNRRAGKLSGGMKQKLALSCNLIHSPKLLILDEPTTGVDPLSRRQFWDILKTLRDDGSSIIVSTPYMDEVELANRAIFMHGGKKLAEGDPGDLPSLYNGHVFRIDVEPTSERINQLRGIDGLESRRFGASLHAYTDKSVTENEMRTGLEHIGIRGGQVKMIDPELEDVFIQLMGS